MADMNRVGFEKAFKKAVPNFDETKIHFQHKSKMYEPSLVCFVWQSKLWKCEMYKSQYEIDNWKNHFIEFLNTGKFDYNAYWKKYESVGKANERRFIEDEIYKIPLCKHGNNDCYEHSPELQEFYKTEKAKGIGKQYGFTTVPKPL